MNECIVALLLNYDLQNALMPRTERIMFRLCVLMFSHRANINL